MQTILGANGTIGSVLAKELKSYTNKIRQVSRHPKKINDTDELFPADLTDPLQVEKPSPVPPLFTLLQALNIN